MITVIILLFLVLLLNTIKETTFQSVKSEAQREREEVLTKEYVQYKQNVTEITTSTFTKTILLKPSDSVRIGPFKFSYVYYNPGDKMGFLVVTTKRYGGIKYRLCLSDLCDDTQDISLRYKDYDSGYEYLLTGVAKIVTMEDIIDINGEDLKYEGTAIIVNMQISLLRISD